MVREAVMSTVIQVKFKDLDSWEQALIHQGFEGVIGFWELRGMVASDNRRYVSDILERLFIYSYDISMGYNTEDVMQELGLIDGEVKAYNTILLLMRIYIKVLKSGNRLWLNDEGIYVWRE